MQGTVKWCNKEKSYGFIECDGDGDVFVHYSASKAQSFKDLLANQRVEFDATQSSRGPQAARVV